MTSKASSSFLNYSARPDSDLAASPLSHGDARPKKLFFARAKALLEPAPTAQIKKSLFASFSSEKEVLFLKAFA